MKRYLDYLWPIIGLVAVVWSVELLWDKLKTEALTNEAIAAQLEQAGLYYRIGPHNVHANIDAALEHARELVKSAAHKSKETHS